MESNIQDTPLAVLLRLLADLMTVNILTLFCSLPVVTAGAAFTAMYAVLMERERTGSVSVFSTYFKALAGHFWKGTLVTLLILALLIAAGGDIYFGMTNPGLTHFLYWTLGIGLAIVALAIFTLAYPMLVSFRNSLGGILKNSLLLFVAIPWKVALCWVAWILPWALLVLLEQEFLVRFGVVYLILGLSGPGCITAKLTGQIFRKVQGKKTD